MSVTYRYHCITENLEISESRNETDLAPTVCINNAGHVIDQINMRTLNNDKRERLYRYGRDPLPTDDQFAVPVFFQYGDKWTNTLTNTDFLCTDATRDHAVWVVSSRKPSDIHISFSTNTSTYIERNGDAAYRLIAALNFPGTSNLYGAGIKKIVLLTSASNAMPIQWRIYDTGTNKTVCQSTSQTHFRDFQQVELLADPLAVSASTSKWEIQIRDVVDPPALSHTGIGRLQACSVLFE
jgi:hypothetical protein